MNTHTHTTHIYVRSIKYIFKTFGKEDNFMVNNEKCVLLDIVELVVLIKIGENSS